MTTDPKAGNLAVALASTVFLFDDAGHPPNSAALQLACKALRQASVGEADARGLSLVEAVALELGSNDADYETVLGTLTRLYGAAHLDTDMGPDREERLHAARRYHFQSSLPWLAEIVDRFPDGRVGSHWVMVEAVTDVVRCMDQYPWDDVDEEVEIPVVEFMVKWELAGARSIRWKA